MFISGKCRRCESTINFVNIEHLDVREGFRWNKLSLCALSDCAGSLNRSDCDKICHHRGGFARSWQSEVIINLT